jgi:hypothetical protein
LVRLLGLFFVGVVLCAAQSAAATSVTFASDVAPDALLAWGQPRPILDPRTDPVTSGPVALGDGVVFSSTTATSLLGYTGSYSFGGNGSWASLAKPMMGLNAAQGDLILDFATPISAIIAQTDWSDLGLAGQPVTVSIFDDAHNLLEKLVLGDGQHAMATPGSYIGFLRTNAEIGRIEFSNGFIGVRDFYSRYVSNPGVASDSAAPDSGGGWDYWYWYTHGGREWELATNGPSPPQSDLGGPPQGPGDPPLGGGPLGGGLSDGGLSDGGPAGDPLPGGPLSAPVPEPSTWALMLVGFGAMGTMLRASRRRQAGLA